MDLKKKKTIKIALFCAIFLSVLLIIWLSLYEPQKPTNNPFWVHFSGKVTYSNAGSTLERPQDYINIYHYPNNPNSLCDATSAIDFPAKITWINETEGEYGISFEVPIETKITLTTSCTSCYSQTVNVSRQKENYVVDLEWGQNNCATKGEDYNNSVKAFKRAVSLLAYTSNDLIGILDQNNTKKENAKIELQQGWQNIGETGYTFEENETLKFSYLAMYHAWSAKNYLAKIELENCIQSFTKFQSDTMSCYDVPPHRLEVLKSSNFTSRQYTEYDAINRDPDINDVKEVIRRVKNERNKIRTASSDCERALSDSIKDYGLIKDSCKITEKKNFILFWFKSFFLILITICLYLYKDLLLKINFINKIVFDFKKSKIKLSMKIRDFMSRNNLYFFSDVTTNKPFDGHLVKVYSPLRSELKNSIKNLSSFGGKLSEDVWREIDKNYSHELKGILRDNLENYYDKKRPSYLQKRKKAVKEIDKIVGTEVYKRWDGGYNPEYGTLLDLLETSFLAGSLLEKRDDLDEELRLLNNHLKQKFSDIDEFLETTLKIINNEETIKDFRRCQKKLIKILNGLINVVEKKLGIKEIGD